MDTKKNQKSEKIKPRVSVVIPVFNGAAYIGKALESVRAQTFTDYEIIVVDDGSTDETVHCLKTYSEVIRVIHQKNEGHACARNTGIKSARGEFVAFLDADDTWLPEKLEQQITVFDKAPEVGLVHTNIYKVFENGTIRVPDRSFENLNGDNYQTLITRNVHFASPTVMVRRSCLDKVGVFDAKMTRLGSEDRDLWIRIAKEFKVAYIKEPLAYYRVLSDSASRNNTKMMQGRLYALNKIFNGQNGHPWWLKRKAYSNLYKEYGDVLLLSGNYSVACCQFRKSVGYWPGNVYAWLNLYKSCVYPMTRGHQGKVNEGRAHV